MLGIEPQTWASILGGIVGGLVGGSFSLAGVWLARKLQSQGQTQLTFIRPEIAWLGRDTMGGSVPVTMAAAGSATIQVHLDAYNSRDERTGFRRVRVEFWNGSAEVLSVTPDDRTTARPGAATTNYESVDVLNLPAKEWVHVKLRASLSTDATKKIKGCESVKFSMIGPDGVTVRRTIMKIE